MNEEMIIPEEDLYVRMSFPDYQEYMDRDDWVDNVVTIGNSDVLIPKKWLYENKD